MKIIEQRALRGPNRYSRFPAIFTLLDIGELEERPSDTIDGFADRLVARLPSLHEHRCSIGTPGGFIQRLHRGTWAGHIFEHVALELQCLAGMQVGFGKSLGTPEHGVYKIAYRYRVESDGLAVGPMAIDLVMATIEDRCHDVQFAVNKLEELREQDILGPSTQSIVDAAKRRGISAIRLNDGSFLQLGYGVKQRRIQATMTDRTGALGVEIADEKFRTKTMLSQAGLPAPKGGLVTTLEEALEIAEDLGYPVAVKPESGNHGRGITASVSNCELLEHAFRSAQSIDSDVIIEKSLSGFDFRVLVIDGKLVAAARREPAHVVGDGESTIEALIARINGDPLRGVGHENVLTLITVDEMTHRLLKQSGLALGDVLPRAEKVYLKSTANLSTGGSATDVTDEVHPDVQLMCERTARLIGLDCIGIDIVAPGLDKPLDASSSGIVEVNAAPGFRMHVNPSGGKGRDVAGAFVDMLFPANADHIVPIIAVTGTNGKTTTAKLIAHTLKYSGAIAGFAGTTGVEIDGVRIVSGDYSGPEGAHMVLRESTIDHAVLEVARGGILRRGLAFPHCTVGILLNVDEDHLGTDGVDDVSELGLVKATVIEAVHETGFSVLNADDPIVVGLANRARGRLIYFSLRDDHPVVLTHLESGGTAVVLQAGDIVILSSEPPVRVLSVLQAPCTLGGGAEFNTSNVLAATAALHGLGTPLVSIRNGVSTFHSSVTQNPGRLNIIDFVQFKVIVDYGHNVPAVRALGKLLPQITEGRKIVVAHGTGSRTDDCITAHGASLAEVYDEIILTDPDPRRRAAGETTTLMRNGAVANGFDARNIEIVPDEFAAIDRAFERVQTGDLIVVQVDHVESCLNAVMVYFARLVGSSSTV